MSKSSRACAPAPADAARVKQHLVQLCDGIGNRLAGTAGERLGAEYVAARFAEYGLATEVQDFPCVAWHTRRAELKVKRQGRWQAIPIQPNTQSPATAGVVSGEIVYLEAAEPWDMEGRDLRGKIGLIFGPALDDLQKMDRIARSGLAAVLYVDDRFPLPWRIGVGLIAGWIDCLVLPTACIPYTYAWDIVRDGVREARLDLDVETYQSTSQNVVATLPGRQRSGSLVIGAHHDSVALGVGAEDDGAGVAVTLELARLLAASRPLRTVRFATFGWEENLSEGARHYVLDPRNEADRAALMVNFDAIGSWMGTNHVICTGERGLRGWVADHLRRHRFSARVSPEISPYSDQFPFNLVGVPSIWFYRTNFPGSRFFHHSEHDQVDKLDCDLLARTADVAAGLVAEVAGRRELPFPGHIPAAQQREIEGYRKALYDCICDWRTEGLMRPTDRPWRAF